jgi:high-affinity nickel permease
MSNPTLLNLLFLGFTLGLRHGIDWDHIAAITDITGSVVTSDASEQRYGIDTRDGYVLDRRSTTATLIQPMAQRKVGRAMRKGAVLATMYALGHGLLVIVLGLLALWLGAVFPDWLDPIMERLVGVTLIILGGWIFYSICRYGRSFQLKSRWMLIFSLVGRAEKILRSRIAGRPIEHSHNAPYALKTAFCIGLIHGIGAETGSQAILLAIIAGVTTKLTASLLLLAFTIGVLISNSLIAAILLTGFVSASTRQNIYVLFGLLASFFSLLVGICFVMGQASVLPNLQELLNWLFGTHSV